MLSSMSPRARWPPSFFKACSYSSTHISRSLIGRDMLEQENSCRLVRALAVERALYCQVGMWMGQWTVKRTVQTPRSKGYPVPYWLIPHTLLLGVIAAVSHQRLSHPTPSILSDPWFESHLTCGKHFSFGWNTMEQRLSHPYWLISHLLLFKVSAAAKHLGVTCGGRFSFGKQFIACIVLHCYTKL